MDSHEFLLPDNKVRILEDFNQLIQDVENTHYFVGISIRQRRYIIATLLKANSVLDSNWLDDGETTEEYCAIDQNHLALLASARPDQMSVIKYLQDKYGTLEKLYLFDSRSDAIRWLIGDYKG
jgi:hypothetical protein